MINSVKRQHVNHKKKHVGNKTKKKVKKKSNTSKSNTLLKCQAQAEYPIEKVLHVLDTLSLPACYKTKHLLDIVNHPNWMQDVEPISLNAINITPIPFAGSSDVLSWNHDDNDPTLDGTQVDFAIVQVLCINTTKFTSNDLAVINELPRAVPILDDDTPAVDDPILIDARTVAVHDGNQVCGQFNNGADTTVTNLLVYLHDYTPYDHKFKYHVWLTGAVGSNDVYPLGEGKLRVPAPIPSGYIAI